MRKKMKRLSINPDTIRTLTDVVVADVRGGAMPTWPSCPSAPRTCNTTTCSEGPPSVCNSPEC
jgi:hypothetical protein